MSGVAGPSSAGPSSAGPTSAGPSNPPESSSTDQDAAGSSLASGSSALDISLHPLVIINISDHFTRLKSQGDGKTIPRVIGCLLGVQTGRNVEIFNSFEIKYEVIDGFVVVDTTFLKAKQDQYKKVFPKYDLLGWYSTGSEVATSDVHIHKTITEVNESPLYLMMDPSVSAHTKDLPVYIYESEVHIINDAPTTIFARVPFKIETLEAERIAVDHVARITPVGEAGASVLTAHLGGMHSAIKMLNVRLKLLHQYLAGAASGQIPKDHTLLREVASLCNRLPAVDTPKFKADFLNEYNDGLLVTYLASITKSTSAINDLVGICRVLDDKHARRRPMF